MSIQMHLLRAAIMLSSNSPKVLDISASTLAKQLSWVCKVTLALGMGLGAGFLRHPPYIRNALGGRGSPNALSAFLFIELVLDLYHMQIFVCLVAII